MEEIKTLEEYNKAKEMLKNSATAETAFKLALAIDLYEFNNPAKPDPTFALEDMEKAFKAGENNVYNGGFSLETDLAFEDWLNRNYPNASQG